VRGRARKQYNRRQSRKQGIHLRPFVRGFPQRYCGVLPPFLFY
jgi:hypothetical protein